MPEQPSLAAIRARQSALASQHGSVADADQVLSEIVASAHAAIRESIRRLDAIADEIDRAAPNHAALAADTPMGAREFQKFLIARQRETVAVVVAAYDLVGTNEAILQSLRDQYAGADG